MRTIETITNRTVNQNEWIKASFWNAFYIVIKTNQF